MGRAARQLENDRDIRNVARAVFYQRLSQVRDDVDARGIGGRVADRAAERASEMIEEAAAVADHNRGLIAGTIAAVAIWLLRSPIIAWIEGLLGIEEEASDEQD